MNDWRLLLTRPAEESVTVAQELAAAGIYSASLPLLHIEPLPVTPAMVTQVLNLAHYCAVIVISKPAARLGLDLIDQYWPQLPSQSWFSVGAATAAIVEGYGLRVHTPPQGDDSEALMALPALAEALAQPYPKVLILKGEGGRQLLAEHLREQGATVDYLQLYQRSLPDYPAQALYERVTAERLNALVVSSGQGFEHLKQLAGEHWPQLAGLPLFVPSPRVAAQAQAAGARHVVDCRGASTTALLAALQEYRLPG
ncbi:uroporphyrinogen-III synthase [Pseudomonas sp. M47T1]|uniref:uroporphyrinogen-III synthase n=1 Tax=unclassified Pseudomonas TaxID=196821 RepID=UPI000260752C|nr:uroporphyrinogen-III synthase [Pseudomonas sp. M47T1]EIK97276.1 uroporphyrinogen-III synthase [Pseudomonas sp. M47T1]